MVSPCPQSYTFLISSDYERAEWRENIREQQKKCEWPPGWGGGAPDAGSGASALWSLTSFSPAGWAVEFTQVRCAVES